MARCKMMVKREIVFIGVPNENMPMSEPLYVLRKRKQRSDNTYSSNILNKRDKWHKSGHEADLTVFLPSTEWKSKPDFDKKHQV